MGGRTEVVTLDLAVNLLADLANLKLSPGDLVLLLLLRSSRRVPLRVIDMICVTTR